jgi:uncharacterized protein YcbX
VTAFVAAIWRHPIKAHGRERLDEVLLEAGRTLPGDRAWAILHEAGRAVPGEWAKCANFTRGAGSPALMAIDARTLPGGRLSLTHPDRPEIVFHPPTEGAAFLAWVAPLMDEGRAAPVGLIPAPADQGMTDVPDPWLSLFGLASHREVATRLAAPDLSPLRWRANLMLDGLEPWEEFGWVGREIRIGDATLEVRERIGRCLATAANPTTGVRDADTLGTLEAIHGERHFAVYAEVVAGGRVATGDPVEAP